jgi:phosphoribosylaminoimidazole-succinocarboxamide synthase
MTPQGIPDKGKLLTKISLFWFQKLGHIVPNHFVTATIDDMPDEVRQFKDQLEGRTMLVRKAQVIPLEAIVRGYLTGELRTREAGDVSSDASRFSLG